MFDPSKLSPAAISELTELMRSLRPDQIMKMQSLMHNSMAGFNVTRELAEFEASLPADFKEKIMRILTSGPVPSTPVSQEQPPATEDEARLVILRSVAGGLLSPEEALKVLFPSN
jgi:hypothetical protein